MPVTSVKEDWSQRRVEETNAEMTATRVFTVEFNEGDNPVIRPLLALRAPQVPQRGSRYPGNDYLAVTKKTANPFEGKFVYEVTCYYSTRSGSSTEGEEENPLDRKPEVEWLSAVSNEQCDTTIEGEAIMNSSLEMFDPPPTKEVYDLVLRYVRNERNFSTRQASEYKGAINSDSFLGFAEGLVMCTVYDGRKIYDEKWGDYYQVTYEFQIRYDSWKLVLLDRGFRKFTGYTDAGLPIFTEIKDEGEQHKVSEPVNLDGSGGVLPEGEKAAKIPFDIYRKKPFSALRIRV